MHVEPWEWPGGQYLVGLDLGQASDYTALCVLKKTPEPGKATASGDDAFRLDCVMLRRFALGTPYPEVVRSVSELARRPELLHDPDVIRRRPEDGRYEDPLLVIDATGVGRAVVDLFLEGDLGPADVLAATITGGNEATETSWHGSAIARHARVPKLQLVGAVQAGLQTGRLKFVAGLAEADALKRELLSFKVKVNINSGRESFEAWRERDHDDLVLAVAIASWAAARPDRRARFGPSPFADDRW
jgi:hypothetical protein